MKKGNIISLLIFIVFGAMMLVSTFTTFDKGLESALFPLATGTLTVVLSTALLFKSRDENDKSEDDAGHAGILGIFGLIFGFVLAIKYISYLIVIPIFACCLLYFVGKMNLRSIAITVIVLEVFVYIVFYRLLQISII